MGRQRRQLDPQLLQSSRHSGHLVANLRNPGLPLAFAAHKVAVGLLDLPLPLSPLVLFFGQVGDQSTPDQFAKGLVPAGTDTQGAPLTWCLAAIGKESFNHGFTESVIDVFG